MFLDILKPKVLYKNSSFENNVKITWSQILEAKTDAWPLKALKKIFQRSNKNLKFPQDLADSQASTINPIKYLRQFFDSQFFINLIFRFCHNTPEGLET